jgi:acetyl esterase
MAPAGSSAVVMREYSLRNNKISRAGLRPELLTPSVREETLDGPGGPLPVRIYTPADDRGAAGRPLIVFFHGGGWVLCDLETHHGAASRLSIEVGAVVVSVGYRLAPEDRFPAAYDDCLAATEWVIAQGDRLGADPNLLIVAGDSAGGQLAASVAIAARDAGWPLAAQLLFYPVTMATGAYADERVNAQFVSRTAHAGGPGLTLLAMTYFTNSYVDPADANDWRVSPLSADLTGVAPAVVHTAGFDLLRDEGSGYVAALRKAGVPVIAREYASLNHGYFGLGGVSKAADAAGTQAAGDLREILGLAPLSSS